MRNPGEIANQLIQPLWAAAFVMHGLLAGGWSPASVLVCFWFERLTRNLLTLSTIMAHRNITNARGHYRPQMNVHGGGLQVTVSSELSGSWVKPRPRTTKTIQPTTFVGEFATMAIVSEVIVVALLAWLLSRADDWTAQVDVLDFVQQEWQSKAWIVVLPMLIGFALEMTVRIRTRSFAWMRDTAMVNMRTGNLILTVALVGLGMAHFSKEPDLLVFACLLVVAKALHECSLAFFGRDWEMRLNDRIAAGMSESGKKEVEQERQRRLDDEQPASRRP